MTVREVVVSYCMFCLSGHGPLLDQGSITLYYLSK